MELVEIGAPIDVLWFRISRKPEDPRQVLGNLNFGKALILIDRMEYFQAGMIIRKGSFEEMKDCGLDAFRASIVQVAPYLADRVEELRDWDQVKILTVQLNRLRRWYQEGLLCIGDAAHAMSPAGGVGINLAIQDAVAAANLLTKPLLRGSAHESVLAKVQRRREFPTRITQAVQVLAHKGFARLFDSPEPLKVSWSWKAALRIPGIHRALGYGVGIGVRPEHPTIGTRRQKKLGRAFGAGIAVGVAVTLVILRGIRKTRRQPAALAA